MTLIMKSSTVLKSPKYPVAFQAIPSLAVEGYENRWNAEAMPHNVGDKIATVANTMSGPWGSLIQPTVSLQPSMASEGGFKHIDNASTTALLMPTITPPTTGPKTVVLVAKILGGNTAILGANGLNWNIGITTTKFYMNAGLSVVGPNINTAWHVFIAVFNGANSVFSVDGVEYVGNAGTNQPTNIRMFSVGGTSYTTGGVREVAIYPSALSLADRQKLNTSLRKKYAI